MTGARMIMWGAAIIAVLFVAVATWKWSDWQALAGAGAAYAARTTCSCRYIEGRSTESCAEDVDIEAAYVSVTEVPETRRVTARVPLLGRAEVQYREGYGCLMEPE